MKKITVIATRLIATLASKLNTKTLLKIDNILIVLKLRKLRSIVTGELYSRNDLLSNIL